MVELQNIPPGEFDPAADDPARRGDQTQDGEGGDGFAGSGFPHEAQGLPGRDFEGNPIRRPDHTLGGEEVGLEIINLK